MPLVSRAILKHMQETVVSLQQAPDSMSRLMFSAPFLVNHNRDADLFAERTSRLLARRAGLKTFSSRAPCWCTNTLANFSVSQPATRGCASISDAPFKWRNIP
jgi:hypothetical protein